MANNLQKSQLTHTFGDYDFIKGIRSNKNQNPNCTVFFCNIFVHIEANYRKDRIKAEGAYLTWKILDDGRMMDDGWLDIG